MPVPGGSLVAGWQVLLFTHLVPSDAGLKDEAELVD
jgi:hypothetical protein